ncbi:MAG TPA: PPOX class F420-dependent oxidoreductase [Streptosporangiaceae bacterium]|nr:PPOX class F420-dependent oxidoreductase [Streptosporangiaceae bacterium]
MAVTQPTLESFEHQKTVLLTTFKRDGTPVGTPVSIVVRDGRAYFRTWHTSGKAKRLNNNPEVEVAPFRDRFGLPTGQGTQTGPAIRGKARLLDDAEARPIRRELARKYPVLQRWLVPLNHKMKGVRTLHYEFIPHS